MNKDTKFFKKIAEELEEELDIPKEVIYLCIKSEFDFINKKISSMNLYGITEEDLESQRLSFNLPYFGKIYTDNKIINKLNKYETKKDKTVIYEDSNDIG